MRAMRSAVGCEPPVHCRGLCGVAVQARDMTLTPQGEGRVTASQVASDLVLAIALVWALPLLLAIVTGLLRVFWNAM